MDKEFRVRVELELDVYAENNEEAKLKAKNSLDEDSITDITIIGMKE